MLGAEGQEKNKEERGGGEGRTRGSGSSISTGVCGPSGGSESVEIAQIE